MVTPEDLEFLPYFDANLGRVFTKDVKENIRLFIKEFRESEFGSRLASEGLATGANLDAILAETQKRFGRDEIYLPEFIQTAKSMWMNGDLVREQQPAASVEPEIERDRLGRPLSPKSRQWKCWQEWCNDPNTNMREIQELRRANSAFAEFYANQSAQERAGGVGDAVEDLSERRIREQTQITSELRQFADDYRHMSSAQLKSLLSPLMTGQEAAAHYQQLLDQAIAAGLI